MLSILPIFLLACNQTTEFPPTKTGGYPRINPGDIPQFSNPPIQTTYFQNLLQDEKVNVVVTEEGTCFYFHEIISENTE